MLCMQQGHAQARLSQHHLLSSMQVKMEQQLSEIIMCLRRFYAMQEEENKDEQDKDV